MKRVAVSVIAILLFLNSYASSSLAYSYGNPNEEAIAEAYKKMVQELNANPPDYSAAKAQYDGVREEIDMHMGAEPSSVIDRDFEAEDKDAIIRDMQKILVLNIARRLTSIEKDFENYSVNKRLLAKALATYEALSPVVQQKDSSLDPKIREQFEAALDSLGNPGLFGVGKKEPDSGKFQESKEFILSNLQKQFGLKSLEVGHFTEGEGPGNELNRKKNGPIDLSDPKNWIPIGIILLVIVAIMIYALRRKRGHQRS